MRLVTGDSSDWLADEDIPQAEIRYLLSFNNLKEVTLILEDTVVSILFQEPYAVKIQSTEHAAMMKVMFEHFWSATEDREG